ncbi:MAG: alpha/beta hydrolase [Coprobacillaceae bacterium]
MKKQLLLMICMVLLVGCSYQDVAIKEEGEKTKVSEKLQTVNENTTVQEIINHPLFEGYGQFLFPTGFNKPSSSMTIDNIDSLLPYHSNIKTETTIEVINYMLDKVNRNQTFFYDIYSDEEKQRDSTKENTGLFFFKGNTDAPLAIINAGGGFAYVGSIHESFPHALELSKLGYNAFALQYRTDSADTACEDLATAIAFIHEHAEELEIDVENYSIWGGSAGARITAYLGSYGTEAFIQKAYPSPAAIIMQYTGHSDFTENDPPTYACVGDRDGIANWQVMRQRINNLQSLGIDTEFQLFSSIGHGFGLGIGTSAEGWIEQAILFWEKQRQ